MKINSIAAILIPIISVAVVAAIYFTAAATSKHDTSPAVPPMPGSVEALQASMPDFFKITPINLTSPTDNKLQTDTAQAPTYNTGTLTALLRKVGTDFNKDSALDVETNSFLTNKNISRSEKIAALWNVWNTLIADQPPNAYGLHYLSTKGKVIRSFCLLNPAAMLGLLLGNICLSTY